MPSKKKNIHQKNESYLKTVGCNIQSIMTKQEITHEIFYIDTNINPHRLLSGKTNMTITTLKRIADYLQVEVKDLV